MATFNMYTYQFNPVLSLPSGSLFDEFFSQEQDIIMAHKNSIFEDAILTAINDSEFYHRRRKLSAQLIFHQKDIIVFRIANKRRVILEKKFIESIETNEPSTLIIVYNNYNIQRIAIEQHREAFPNTDIVARVIQNATSRLMYISKLNVSIRKEYCETEFWNFVKANPNQIQMIRFEFEYPNLPRLREYISDIIKDTGRSISGERAIVQYETTNGALKLEENNETLKELNRVSSESGNPITFRLRGMREHQKTGRTTITKEIDELDITAEKADDIIKILEAVGNDE